MPGAGLLEPRRERGIEMGYEFEFEGMEQPMEIKENLQAGLEGVMDHTSDMESADDIIKNLSDLKERMDGQESAGDIIRNLREMDGNTEGQVILSMGEAAEELENGENDAMQDINEAASEWHLQESDMSCAVASQELLSMNLPGAM